MYKGLRFLLDNRGKRNMVLWGGGDWNDSINNTGNQLKGESAWLSIATVKATDEFCRICEIMGGKEDLISKLQEEKAVLKAAILEHAFEGDRFIYGINDWDEKVGSEDSVQAKMYLNTQTWAVLADMLDTDGLNKIMNTVEEKLRCDYGYVQCSPAYSKKDLHIGRMAYFIPGGFENGSVYNHGVAFKIAADCKLGKADLAFETLKLISFDNPANIDSGVEPYVVSNMYLGPQDPNRPGYAPYSWITGTAGWIYRDVTESIMGVKGQYTGLEISPCMPTIWDEAFVSRVYRDATYNITFKRTGEYKLTVDGEVVEGNIAPIFPAGTEHTVVCEF
jgi:cellobiose phosphorylase